MGERKGRKWEKRKKRKERKKRGKYYTLFAKLSTPSELSHNVFVSRIFSVC